MTCEGRGAYIALLCHAWESDGVEDKPRVLAALTGASAEAIAEAKAKFAKHPDGKLRNARMESVRSKLKDYRESQAEIARKGWVKRKGDPMATHKLPIGEPEATHRLPNGYPMPYQSQSQSQSNSQTQNPKPKPERESAREESDEDAGGAEIPTKAEVIDYGDRAGVPAWYAEKFHGKKDEARTWANKFGMLKDWRREMLRWYAEDGRPVNAPERNGSKPTPAANGKPSTPWEIKTTLEAVTTKFTENRHRHRADVAGGEYVWDDDEARKLDRKLAKRKRELNDQLAGV